MATKSEILIENARQKIVAYRNVIGDLRRHIVSEMKHITTLQAEVKGPFGACTKRAAVCGKVFRGAADICPYCWGPVRRITYNEYAEAKK